MILVDRYQRRLALLKSKKLMMLQVRVQPDCTSVQSYLQQQVYEIKNYENLF